MRASVDEPQSIALGQKVVPVLFFARLMFPTTPVYFHTGLGPITFNSNTYTGVGELAILDKIEESLENRPPDIVIGLQRIPTTLIDPVINEKYHNKAAYLYYSVADAAGQPVSNPFEVWRGTMETIELQITDAGLRYLVTLKNIMANWQRARPRRITDSEQQKRYAGDTAYRHLAENEDKKVTWGPDPNKSNNSQRPPRGGYKGSTYER